MKSSRDEDLSSSFLLRVPPHSSQLSPSPPGNLSSNTRKVYINLSLSGLQSGAQGLGRESSGILSGQADLPSIATAADSSHTTFGSQPLKHPFPSGGRALKSEQEVTA